MPIIPNQHFQFLAEERGRQDLANEQSLQTTEYAQQKLRQAMLTNELNQVFDEFNKTKDPQLAKQRLTMVSARYADTPAGQKMATTNWDDYFGGNTRPVLEYDPETRRLNKIEDVARDATVIRRDLPKANTTSETPAPAYTFNEATGEVKELPDIYADSKFLTIKPPQQKPTVIKDKAPKIPQGFTDTGKRTPDGEIILEKVEVKPEKPPTAAQETTALYASRLKQANGIFDQMESYINNLPVVGTKMNELAPNFMKSDDYQSYEQAQRNFLNAVLRRESGAVISPTEFAEGKKQYFPQPGDGPQVLAQKKANRDLVMQSFIKSSGSAYVPYHETTSIQNDIRAQYNALREQGYTAEQAKQQLGM